MIIFMIDDLILENYELQKKYPSKYKSLSLITLKNLKKEINNE